MSDLPPPHPLDEQANQLLDAGAPAPAGDGALAARLAELRAVRTELRDVPAPDPTRRELAVAAALDAFDAGAAEPGAGPGAAAPVVPLTGGPRSTTAVRAGSGASRWVLGVAAAVLAAGLVGAGVVAARRSGTGTSGSALRTASGAAATAGAAKAADSASTAAEAYQATPAATTTIAASGGAPLAPPAASTAAAGAGTTAAAPRPARDATLPYLGDVGSQLQLDQAARPLTDGTTAADGTTATTSTASGPTTTAASTAATAPPGGGDDVRRAFSASPCDPEVAGTPLALLRWQGQPAVLVRSGDTLRVVGLGSCAVLAERPVGG